MEKVEVGRNPVLYPLMIFIAVCIGIFVSLIFYKSYLLAIASLGGLLFLFIFFLYLDNLKFGFLVLIVSIPVSNFLPSIHILNIFELKLFYILVLFATISLVLKSLFDRNSNFLNLPTSKILLSLLFLCFLSSFWASNPIETIKESFQLLVYVILFILTANIIKSKKMLDKVTNTWIIVTLIVSIFALSQLIGFFIFPKINIFFNGSNVLFNSQDISWVKPNTFFIFQGKKIIRLHAIFYSPIWLASFLLIGFFLSLTVLFCRKINFNKKLLYFISAFIIGLALLLTFTRGAILSVIITFLIFSVLSKRKRYFWASFLIFSILIILFFSPFVHRMSSLLYSEEASLSLAMHWDLMKTSLITVRDNFLLGVGYGNFPLVHGKYIPSSSVLNPENLKLPAHNFLLQLGAELGIIGLIIFSFFIIYLLKNTLIALRFDKVSLTSHFMLGWFLGTFSVLLHSLTTPNPAEHFWISAAVTLVASGMIVSDKLSSERNKKI